MVSQFLYTIFGIDKILNYILSVDNIQFVNLPRRSASSTSFVNRIARISGWGLAADGSERINPVLRRVNVRVMRNFICNIQYLGFIRNTHVCTSGRGGRGSCSGDSGGPLTVDDVQVGLIRIKTGFNVSCLISF